MNIKAMVAALVALLILSAGATTSKAAAAPEPMRFSRGVNILGYDPIWKDPAKARFKERYFGEIRAAGFDFVRVNLQAFQYMDASNRLPPAWLDRLDWVVKEATEAGLGVILDEHDFNPCSADPEACRPKLMSFWSQVAERYRNAPPSVAFELLNEPHQKLNAAKWNAMAAELLALVRRANPTRAVVIGPTQWNSRDELHSLRLPEDDRNIIVTYHYYHPFRFTHQGASWTNLTDLRDVTWGSPSDYADLKKEFAKVAAWAKANNRPILLGEFGAYDKSGTPLPMIAAYNAAVAREAEANGFAWAYWQFDSDFVVYDVARDQWVQPIRDALIPPRS